MSGNKPILELRDIKKGSKLYLETDLGEEVFIFDHLDGVYSYCYGENNKNRIIHLSFATPLGEYKDGYKIKEIKP